MAEGVGVVEAAGVEAAVGIVEAAGVGAGDVRAGGGAGTGRAGGHRGREAEGRDAEARCGPGAGPGAGCGEVRRRANGRNAQHSTGPRTAGGKARSSQNSLRHGLFARRLVVAGESAAEFAAFAAEVRAGYAPRGMDERVLVERIVADLWRLQRISGIESVVVQRLALRQDAALAAEMAMAEGAAGGGSAREGLAGEGAMGGERGEGVAGEGRDDGLSRDAERMGGYVGRVQRALDASVRQLRAVQRERREEERELLTELVSLGDALPGHGSSACRRRRAESMVRRVEDLQREDPHFPPLAATAGAATAEAEGDCTMDDEAEAARAGGATREEPQDTAGAQANPGAGELGIVCSGFVFEGDGAGSNAGGAAAHEAPAGEATREEPQDTTGAQTSPGAGEIGIVCGGFVFEGDGAAVAPRGADEAHDAPAGDVVAALRSADHGTGRSADHGGRLAPGTRQAAPATPQARALGVS